MSEGLFLPEHLENYLIDGSSCEIFMNPQQVYPSMYLEYARNDEGSSDDTRGLINAISNAKRAFHLQVEMLCNAFGWQHLVPKNRNNFGSRLDFLKQCGVLSPNILRKLNTIRNKVEHEYTIPMVDQVTDYVDIVELFLMATKMLLDRFPTELDYTLIHDEYYDSTLRLPEAVRTSIVMGCGGINIKYGDTTVALQINDANYFIWLSSIVRQYVL